MPLTDWTPETHERRILSRLAEGPLTQKGVMGGLAPWWKRNDCVDALERLIARGEVLEFPGPRRPYFRLKDDEDGR
jgi:hypothetical protein